MPVAYRLSEPETQTGIGWLFPTATGLGIGVWIGLGLGFGLARGRRSALVGSVVGLVLMSVPLWAATLGPDRAAALGASAAVLVSGLLPRYAATAAGLTGLDDQVVEGRHRLRAEVQASVDRAYAALTWSTFGVASGIAVAAGVLLAAADPWAVGVGIAVLLVIALRTRVFPLAAQQMALWLAVVGAGVLGLVSGQPGLDSAAAHSRAGRRGPADHGPGAGPAARPPAGPAAQPGRRGRAAGGDRAAAAAARAVRGVRESCSRGSGHDRHHRRAPAAGRDRRGRTHPPHPSPSDRRDGLDPGERDVDHRSGADRRIRPPSLGRRGRDRRWRSTVVPARPDAIRQSRRLPGQPGRAGRRRRGDRGGRRVPRLRWSSPWSRSSRSAGWPAPGCAGAIRCRPWSSVTSRRCGWPSGTGPPGCRTRTGSLTCALAAALMRAEPVDGPSSGSGRMRPAQARRGGT